MIKHTQINKDNKVYEVISYYANDAIKFLNEIDYSDDIKYLGKEYIIKENNHGIIIGVEYNEYYNDVYWIVFSPELNLYNYPMVNNTKTIKNIIE